MNLIKYFFDLDCFNKLRRESKWSYEKFDRSRVKYAQDNPWVMNYDFGHKELVEYWNRFDNTII